MVLCNVLYCVFVAVVNPPSRERVGSGLPFGEYYFIRQSNKVNKIEELPIRIVEHS